MRISGNALREHLIFANSTVDSHIIILMIMVGVCGVGWNFAVCRKKWVVLVGRSMGHFPFSRGSLEVL
jgi:hypothetical protein